VVYGGDLGFVAYDVVMIQLVMRLIRLLRMRRRR